MRVTVVICTWNRASSLARTLEAFSNLVIPADTTWELLVVNNNSTDHTDQIVAEHAQRLPIRRLFEPRPGKSHAANMAVTEASGDLLLWTDDDVLVDRQWLAEYVSAAETWPSASYFGGTVDPFFDGPVPRWIRRHVDLLYEPYALAQHRVATCPVQSENIVGANMALRADVAKKNPFDIRLGPAGHRAFVTGEETDLVGRLRGSGALGVWVGTARVRHVIGSDRLSAPYLWHWYGGLGAYLVEQDSAIPAARLLGAPRWAVRQYAGLYLKYVCLWPLKTEAWVRTLRQAALMRGYIRAARDRSAAGVKATA
jgi:glycosyltransferase involved in cell wall biosynthesis